MPVSGYGDARRFTFEWREVETVEPLARLLSELSADPTAAISLCPAVVPEGLRRAHARPGEAATIPPAPFRVLPVDLDDVPTGGLRADAKGLREIATRLRALLPEGFRAAACVVQASSSYGSDPWRASIRLWFIASRPLLRDEARAWLAASEVEVDLSMWDAARVIYTAAPIVEGGPDPIAKRWLLLDGEPFARVPDLSVENLFTPRARPAPRPDAAHWVVPEAGSVEEVPPPEWLDDRAFRHVARVGYGVGGDRFHEPIRALTLSAVTCHAGKFPAAEFYEWLCRLIDARGAVADPGKNAERKEMARRALADAIGKVAMERAGEEELEGAPLPTLTADEAGEEVARLLGGWFGSLADKTEPSEAMLTASLGVGKTHRLADALAAWAALNPTRRALVRVPTHELAADLRDMIEARSPGISGVHLGLERADPNAEGALMCRRVADVTTARTGGRIGLDDMRIAETRPLPASPGQSARREAVRLPPQDNRDARIVLVAGDVSLGNAPPAASNAAAGSRRRPGNGISTCSSLTRPRPRRCSSRARSGSTSSTRTDLSDSRPPRASILSGKDAALSFNDTRRPPRRARPCPGRARGRAAPELQLQSGSRAIDPRARVAARGGHIDDAAAGRSGRRLEGPSRSPGRSTGRAEGRDAPLGRSFKASDDGPEGLPHVRIVTATAGGRSAQNGPIRRAATDRGRVWRRGERPDSAEEERPRPRGACSPEGRGARVRVGRGRVLRSRGRGGARLRRA